MGNTWQQRYEWGMECGRWCSDIWEILEDSVVMMLACPFSGLATLILFVYHPEFSSSDQECCYNKFNLGEKWKVICPSRCHFQWGKGRCCWRCYLQTSSFVLNSIRLYQSLSVQHFHCPCWVKLIFWVAPVICHCKLMDHCCDTCIIFQLVVGSVQHATLT